MALNEPSVAKTSAAADPGGAAPAWVFPLYAGGMALVFFGQRVLSGLEKGAGAVTAIGLLCVVLATALRFSPRFKSGGERKSIETLLALLSLAGVVALLMWLYLTGYLIILGAEINSEMERQTVMDTTEGPSKPMGQRGAYAADTVGPTRQEIKASR